LPTYPAGLVFLSKEKKKYLPPPPLFFQNDIA